MGKYIGIAIAVGVGVAFAPFIGWAVAALIALAIAIVSLRVAGVLVVASIATAIREWRKVLVLCALVAGVVLWVVLLNAISRANPPTANEQHTTSWLPVLIMGSVVLIGLAQIIRAVWARRSKKIR